MYLTHFIPSSLYLLILFIYLAPPSNPSPLETTSVFSCLCEFVSLLSYSFMFHFQIPHIRENIQYLSLSDLYSSYCKWQKFFFMASIPLYIHTTLLDLFICLWTQVSSTLAIINNTAINTGLHMSISSWLSNLLAYNCP